MEVDSRTNTSQINSLLNGSLKIVDLNKKRKLEDEQLGLPVSKHQCWKQILPPKPPAFFGIVEVDGALSTCTTEVKGSNVYNASETGSDKGSNSFPRNSYSMMSSHTEAKFGMFTRFPLFSSLSRSVEKAMFSPGEETEAADVEPDEKIEESLVEYGSHMDFICSEYGNYSLQKYINKEIEELLEPNEAHPNDYVLSPGRWNVNQGNPVMNSKNIYTHMRLKHCF
ncbi:Far-red elongated hypocotyl 1, putative isoform 2 [Hibiscus syriacus]|uniref:Far-red elongated hypocotyl 1, putative isoform 2 n=1 Tax=Hibiscus syriacus TaxID=106335 RepID=A0A6A2ZL90_HIBSY|nr:Far-red elongated hypocotyl 1, putative isoform 2 [Hibiscus syriacus]